MQGMTGGELLFRRNRHDKSFPLPITKNEYITKFLDYDDDRNLLHKYYQDRLTKLRRLSIRQRNLYQCQENFAKKLAPELLQRKHNDMISKVSMINDILARRRLTILHDTDVRLMQNVLNYFAIVNRESKVTCDRKEAVHKASLALFNMSSLAFPCFYFSPLVPFFLFLFFSPLVSLIYPLRSLWILAHALNSLSFCSRRLRILYQHKR